MAEHLCTIRQKVKKRARPSPRAAPVEEDFASFFPVSMDLLCIAGFDGYFKRLNPAWTSCLGLTVEEFMARPFLDLVHQDDRAATQAEIDGLAKRGGAIFFENRCRQKDGSYRWLQWNAWSPPGVGQIYASALDVTRRRRLEKEVLEILDSERERLGRELHDGLCQTLAGIAALSATLSKRLAASDDSVESAAAAEITKLLSECIGEARDLARGLSPGGLNDACLAEALEGLALNVQNLFRVSCTLECERPFFGLGPNVGAHLFRLAQEAVNNAVAHGRAERIEISLTSKDGEGLLSVRDDGIGMSEEKRNRKGIGLHTMAYRARLIGASLMVRRRLRRGTAVICTFPLSDPAASSETQARDMQEASHEISSQEDNSDR